jgi:hypothetical protein
MTHVPEADLDYYFDRLLPRVLPEASSDDPADCAIKKREIYVVGREDRGKNNVAKLIVNEAVRRYGKSRVAVDQAEAKDFGVMMRTSWQQNKDIQVKICNDATKVGIPDEDIHLFFRLRHEMQERTGFREGLCATILLTHRIHSTPAAMHDAGYDSLLILSPPAKGSWDWNFLKNLVGEDALLELGKRDREGQMDPSGEKKGWMLVLYEDEFLGITKIPRLSFATKVREIKGDRETSVDSGVKVGRGPGPVPLKESLILNLMLLGMILVPWLYIYLVIRYPAITLNNPVLTRDLPIIVLSAFFSVGFVVVRISRWLKEFRAKRKGR